MAPCRGTTRTGEFPNSTSQANGYVPLTSPFLGPYTPKFRRKYCVTRPHHLAAKRTNRNRKFLGRFCRQREDFRVSDHDG
jgi:hypothetical protein